MNYLGDTEQINYIESFLLGKKNHHSIIFSGQKGIGKATAAKEIVSNIIAKQNGNEAFNLKWISPESKSGKITIDQIREISPFLNQTNFDGKFKFIVIDSADNLNINAANSLLKPIEEPNNDCFFILINHTKSSLLPTLKSRCIEFSFKALSTEDVAKILREKSQVDKSIAAEYSIISGQNVGMALALMENGSLEIYQKVIELITAEKFDFITEQKIFDQFNLNDNWEKFFFLLKRICYVAILNGYTEISQCEEEFLNKRKNLDIEDFAKFVDHLNNMQYKINNLYLNKRDTLHIILLKLFNLCQKTST